LKRRGFFPCTPFLTPLQLPTTGGEIENLAIF
jgi:hypothetical protein